jgi:N-acetylmuramoyl-L-alanine amidase
MFEYGRKTGAWALALWFVINPLAFEASAQQSAPADLGVGAQLTAPAAAPKSAPVKTIPIAPDRSVAAAPKRTAGPADADGNRLGGTVDRTRFVIGVAKSVTYQVFSLQNPNRVVVEIADQAIQLPEPVTEPVGLVKSFIGGLSAPGRSRVVIDVTRPVIVESARFDKLKEGNGERLVLDIVPVDGGSSRRLFGSRVKTTGTNIGSMAMGLSSEALQPPLPQPALTPKQLAAKAYKPTIVIDPGHGGKDSGATKFGIVEKDVVLAFSLILRDKLIKSGRYNVLMTRDTDVFIELDERRDIGERNKAALFIAVHADYSTGGARGATIYSLRDRVADEMRRSAKGEVAANVLTAKELETIRKANVEVSPVQNILRDFAVKEVEANHDRTNEFTRIVIENMGAATPMRHSPDQQATFRVLKTAKMPSVLIELAFVSNQQDAQNLKSDQWRKKVADSIFSAVENYFSNQAVRLPL